MKSTITLLFLTLFSSFSFSQTEKYQTEQHIMTMRERYNFDYKLKDYTFIDGDSSILDLFDVNNYETHRLTGLGQYAEIFISEINQTLILFPYINQ